MECLADNACKKRPRCLEKVWETNLGKMVPRKNESEVKGIRGTRCSPPLDEINTEVLFRSESYVIVNKPADVRLDGNFDCTLEKMLKRDVYPVDKFRWIHQLDYATSGVMCVGLTRKATGEAAELFRERVTKKQYTAMVWGHVMTLNDKKYVCGNKRIAGRTDMNPMYNTVPTSTLVSSKDSGICAPAAMAAAMLPQDKRRNGNGKRKRQQREQLQEGVEAGRAFWQEWGEHGNGIQAVDEVDGAGGGVAKAQASREVVKEKEVLLFGWSIAESPDPERDFRMRIGDAEVEGKPSFTQCRVVKRGYYNGVPATVVELRPVSGRRHQLRLHMRAAGHPIVGDATYGVTCDLPGAAPAAVTTAAAADAAEAAAAATEPATGTEPAAATTEPAAATTEAAAATTEAAAATTEAVACEADGTAAAAAAAASVAGRKLCCLQPVAAAPAWDSTAAAATAPAAPAAAVPSNVPAPPTPPARPAPAAAAAATAPPPPAAAATSPPPAAAAVAAAAAAAAYAPVCCVDCATAYACAELRCARMMLHAQNLLLPFCAEKGAGRPLLTETKNPFLHLLTAASSSPSS